MCWGCFPYMFCVSVCESCANDMNETGPKWKEDKIIVKEPNISNHIIQCSYENATYTPDLTSTQTQTTQTEEHEHEFENESQPQINQSNTIVTPKTKAIESLSVVSNNKEIIDNGTDPKTDTVEKNVEIIELENEEVIDLNTFCTTEEKTSIENNDKLANSINEDKNTNLKLSSYEKINNEEPSTSLINHDDELSPKTNKEIHETLNSGRVKQNTSQAHREEQNTSHAHREEQNTSQAHREEQNTSQAHREEQNTLQTSREEQTTSPTINEGDELAAFDEPEILNLAITYLIKIVIPDANNLCTPFPVSVMQIILASRDIPLVPEQLYYRIQSIYRKWGLEFDFREMFRELCVNLGRVVYYDGPDGMECFLARF